MKLTAISDKMKAMITKIISTLLIFLFVYAGFSKIIDHKAFIYSLKNSPLLASHSVIISWTIPLFEIIISLLLFIPKLQKDGLLLSGVLMFIFTLYIFYMIVFVPQLPCTCGGILMSMGWQQHLAFNICFTLLAFFSWFLLKENKDFIAINRTSRTPV